MQRPLSVKSWLPMKVLILNADNQKYIAPDGSWTSTISEAHDFRFSPYAFEVIRKERFINTTVVFYYEDLGYSLKATRTRKASVRAIEEMNAAAPNP